MLRDATRSDGPGFRSSALRRFGADAAGAGSEPPIDVPASELFGQPMAGINSALLAKFNYGLGLFRGERSPVLHPDGSASGPGPLYNATSCIGCHVGEGRGRGRATVSRRSMPTRDEALLAFIDTLMEPGVA